jgi:hypothetical protein
MKIYESKRHAGVKAELLEVRDREATVMMEYITGDKKGKTFDISKSTLKRWWKAVVEDIEQPVDDVKPVESDQEQEPEAEQKVITTKNTTKKSKNKVDTSNYLQVVTNKLSSLGYITQYTQSVKCLKVKKDKKTVCEIYLRSKNMEIRCREVKNPKFLSKDGYKYYLPIHIWIDYSDNYLEDILSTL